MPGMMTVQELNRLAHKIAENAARADVFTFSMPAGDWLEVDEVDDNEQLDRAEQYLTARGLLERNPDNPQQVLIMMRPRAHALEGAA